MNLNIFTNLIQEFDGKTEESFGKMVCAESDLSLFTFELPHIKEYEVNAVGKCVVTKIVDSSAGVCYINDLAKCVFRSVLVILDLNMFFYVLAV